MRYLAGFCIAWLFAAAPLAAQSCHSSAQENKRIVLAFYREALGEMQVRAAFEHHAVPGFIEHSRDVPGGNLEGVIGFLEGLIQRAPQPQWEVIRSIAEGDLVFVHARFIPATDAPPIAVAEIFRLEDCRLVEHWDIIAPPQDGAPVNPLSPF